MSAPSLPPGFDFTDPGLWARRRPVEAFALLRRPAPVWWNPLSDADSGGFHDGGYWVV
ncbi:steroid C27-monooxygenase, partial [Nocardia elegans]|nr:steroid C27-monooxygenase [Nocardia elegans]